jgi:beta-lactamase class A
MTSSTLSFALRTLYRSAAATLVLALLGLGCAGAAGRAPAAPAAPAHPAALLAAPGLDSLGDWIRARSAAEAAGEVAVAVIDLASGARLGFNEHLVMHAASTMKVPVMLELFRQADEGRFSIDGSVVVTNEFTSIADGSRYSLSTEDDSEQGLYQMIGETTTLRDLIRRMIVRSSNLATNILIERAGADRIQALLGELGAGDLRVLRGVQDIPAFERGLNNTATAAALAELLAALARCAEGSATIAPPLQPLSAASCQDMVAILAEQEFNEQIPAGLPTGTRVAHKTGSITEIHHDAAIVYPPGRAPYVLVVLTRGIAAREVSARVAADISRRVWQVLIEDQTAAHQELAALQERYRVSAIRDREFTHNDLWSALGPLLDQAPGLSRTEIARSAEGRPIYRLDYGHGPTRVLLWSQMHGNESTATMALADLVRFLAEAPDHPLARRLAERLTIAMVPMLNPDGVERFQRRNALGIDINRDARMLATPEARALKATKDGFDPAFGFNLHDQNVRTRVGASGRTVAIALLAPPFDASAADNPVRLRAKRVAAVVRDVIEPLVGGHIARYDETFNPRAFGDLMAQWGVSTILIESGGWQDDPQKQYLRQVNFIAILAALDAIATGSYASAELARYESLPENGSSLRDLLVVGGTIVAPGLPAYRADLAIDFSRPLERRGGRIEDIGDLGGFEARDTLDLSGLFLHPEPAMLMAQAAGAAIVSLGMRASFVVRRSTDPNSEVVWIVEEGVARRSQTP